MAAPAISIVFPTIGRPQLLLRSLRALLAGDMLPAEIVVVDQSQQPGTAEVLRELACPLVKHVPSTERGLSRARNTGIAATSSPLIGFIDDDCVPAHTWVGAAVAATLEFPDSAIWIGTESRDERELTDPAVVAAIPRKVVRQRGKGDPWLAPPTGGICLYRRTTFDDVGTFDPVLGQGSTYPGAEDGDMVYRVLRHGHAVTHINTIRCFHVPWRNAEEEARNSHNYGMGVGAMLAKYLAEGDYFPLLVVFPRRFLPIWFSAPVNLLLGRRQRVRVNVSWIRGICAGFRGWRRDQRGRPEAVAP